MKIFVTGATGYVGSHLVKKLIELGHERHALVRSKEKAKNISHENVRIFKGDLLNKESIQLAMKNCEEVYHLAAFANVWDKSEDTYFKMNVVATKNILDAAKIFSVRRVVVTSTAGVYGASMDSEITEDFVRTTDFFNEYESSKALAESWVKDYVINGLDVVIVSPTRIYGPILFGKTASINQLIEKYVFKKWRFIPGDGTRIGNYVFIDDVVNGHVLAMSKGRTGHTYLLAGENHDYNQFFQVLAYTSGLPRKMLNMPISFQMMFARIQLVKTLFGGTPIITPKWIAKGKYHWKVSPQKAVEELGMEITSLEKGLERTIESMEARKEYS
jgi:farnesol dehydrogenase